MRISDWSSDVCSSDLRKQFRLPKRALRPAGDDRLASLDLVEDGQVGQRCDPRRDRHRHALRLRDLLTRERHRSEEHTSELQSLMRISYAVFCLKKKKQTTSLADNITARPENDTASVNTP